MAEVLQNNEIFQVIILALICLGVLILWIWFAYRKRGKKPAEPKEPKVVLKGSRVICLPSIPEPIVLKPILRQGPRIEVRIAPLHKEKGWRQKGKQYIGYFRANGREWAGEILESFKGGFEAYIFNPPPGLHNHIHGVCFNRSGIFGRYKIHFKTMPQNVDHLINNVETILREAVGN